MNLEVNNYKPTAIWSQIQRRMHLRGVDSLGEYTRYLRADQGEIDRLFQDLLIHVSCFFRDPEAFELLGTKILPELFADKPDDYVIRVWVAGCSTGEEAYSIAMVLQETADALNRPCCAQIFATDLAPEAVETARNGRYVLGIANDVSEARLDRFFTRQDKVFRVNQNLRKMVIFAPHDLLQDPPYTELDLLSCRNLLIYFESRLQSRLLPLFHHSLKPGGILFLGSSESIRSDSNLFRSIDRQSKIYARSEVPSTYTAGFHAVTPYSKGEPGL